jgi:hypothetical protein
MHGTQVVPDSTFSPTREKERMVENEHREQAIHVELLQKARESLSQESRSYGQWSIFFRITRFDEDSDGCVSFAEMKEATADELRSNHSPRRY